VERKEAPLARHHHRLDRLPPAAAEGDAAAGDAAGERGERQAEQLTQPAEVTAERAGGGGEQVDGRGYTMQYTMQKKLGSVVEERERHHEWAAWMSARVRMMSNSVAGKCEEQSGSRTPTRSRATQAAAAASCGTIKAGV
jgi:hypothetical protein